MARRRYRSWRSRGSYYQNAPSKFSVLQGLFGEGVIKIRDEFLSFDQETLTEILEEYGEVHGKSAKAYAKKPIENGNREKLNSQDRRWNVLLSWFHHILVQIQE